MSAFPLRIVYRLDPAPETSVAVMISVSKKRFRRAVKRNRVKRQVREAYRLHKHLLWDALNGQPVFLSIAFLWLQDQLIESAVVEKRVLSLLYRLSEKLKNEKCD